MIPSLYDISTFLDGGQAAMEQPHVYAIAKRAYLAFETTKALSAAKQAEAAADGLHVDQSVRISGDSTFHDRPRPSTTFHDLPRPSTAFHDLPRPSTAFHDLPWLSMTFYGLPRPSMSPSTAYPLHLHAPPRAGPHLWRERRRQDRGVQARARVPHHRLAPPQAGAQATSPRPQQTRTQQTLPLRCVAALFAAPLSFRSCRALAYRARRRRLPWPSIDLPLTFH